MESTQSFSRRQIICVGCGFDTISFEFSSPGTTFYEIDYFEIIERKMKTVLSELTLADKVVGSSSTVSEKDAYRDYGFDLGALQLLTADLRDADGVRAALLTAGVEGAAPTLVLTECVLVCKDLRIFGL